MKHAFDHWRYKAKHFNATLEEYTDDALAFWRMNSHRATKFTIDGGLGVGYKIKGVPGGIFTADGKIVTFWYNRR